MIKITKSYIRAYYWARPGITIGAIATFLMFGICEYTPLIGVFMILCSIPEFRKDLQIISNEMDKKKAEGVAQAYMDMKKVKEDITG